MKEKIAFDEAVRAIHQEPGPYIRTMVLERLDLLKGVKATHTTPDPTAKDITQAGQAGPAKGGTEKKRRRAWKKSGGRRKPK